eukprot:m.485140 g.485140  ORF g.485140 m.485140 type:complete len:511 (-) comp21732_c0_seq3:236-1768(-)
MNRDRDHVECSNAMLEKPPDWDSLPEGILHRIFHFSSTHDRLCILNRVCHRWRKIARKSVPRLDFGRWCHNYLTVMAVKRMRASFDGIENLCFLDLSYIQRIEHGAVAELASSGIKPSWFSAACAEDFNDSDLHKLRPACTNLCGIYLSFCENLSSEGIIRLLECSRGGVQYLDLQGCERISDRLLTAVHALCPRLRVINLYVCPDITDDGVRALCGGARLCTEMEGDCERNKRSVDTAERDTNRMPSAEANGVKDGRWTSSLQSVNLSLCTRISDAAVDSIARACVRLHTLTVSGCDLITDKGVISLTRLATIVSLDLSWCTKISDAAIAVLAQRCTQLAHLRLFGCVQLTDAAVRDLAEGCRRLKSLKMSGCSLLSDQACIDLAANARRLKILYLSYCPRITDVGVSALCAPRCNGLGMGVPCPTQARDGTPVPCNTQPTGMPGTRKTDENRLVSDTPPSFAQFNPQLRLMELEVFGCPLLSAECLRSTAIPGLRSDVTLFDDHTVQS